MGWPFEKGVRNNDHRIRIDLIMTVYVLNYREPKPNDVKVIDTTTRSKTWSRALSPMLVGPVWANGIKCENVENAWQFSKVYDEHIDQNNNPTLKYYEWRSHGYKSTWAYRYPMGKGKKPLYSWWDKQKLDYVTARKLIYVPLYAAAVKQTEEYKKLCDLYKTEQKLILLDFDAYDHRKLGMNWNDVLNAANKKMGHAFVLAMLLEGVL